MSATPPPPSDPPVRKPIDARLVQWFAAELILDSRARLVEGGAGGDTRIDLAQVFVDLPADVWRGRDAASKHGPLVQSICQELTERHPASARDIWPPVRALVIGGPGSGKSTGATMIAQLLRCELVRPHLEVVPAQLQARLGQLAGAMPLDGIA
jgi:hypothetical protein